MIVAVTGGIGSGKSFAAQSLADFMHAEYCDVDRICRQLVQIGESGWSGIKQKWGDRFLLPDGGLDRAGLRAAIFDAPDLRFELDALLHPLARRKLEQHVADSRLAGVNLVAEVPLLFESGWEEIFDVTVTVDADLSTCISRVVARDGVTAEHAARILEAQMSNSERRRRAHFVIDNNAVTDSTVVQLRCLAEKLLKRQKY